MDVLTLILIIAAVSPIACAFIARARNKNPISWFCWGIIFGVFPLGYLLVSPSD